MPDDIAYMPLTELVEAFRNKSLSPVDATRAAFERIAAYDGRVNAFCHLDEDGAMASARASEARWAKGEPQGLIDGVPLSVKDTHHVAGMPTRFGSKTSDPAPVAEDSSTTASARAHGAVILGKTTSPEFALGPATNSPLTGITRNPWNLDKTSGGSSGGASAAVAAGMGHVGLGSDGGGSIRIPAAFTGLVGMKATNMRVPAWPPAGVATIACYGALTRTVADTALMMTVMCEADWRDWLALPRDGVDYSAGLEGGVAGLRVAYSPALGYAKGIEPEVHELVAKAARVFADLGATVEEADPGFEPPLWVLQTYLYSRSAYRVRQFTPEQRELLGPNVRDAAEKGVGLSVADLLTADDARAALGHHMQRFHQTYDLLLTPTVSVPAFAADRWYPEAFEGEDPRAFAPFCSPFNLSHQPAISVPCGFTDDGLPVGLHIVGAKYADAAVLRAARAYEAANPLYERRPPLPA